MCGSPIDSQALADLATYRHGASAAAFAASDLDPFPTPALLDSHEAEHLAAAFEAATPQEILRWALQRFSSRVALCTSFQAEGMVLLDMAWRIDPGVRVITLDTGRLPQETHDLMARVHRRYGIDVAVFHPDARHLEAMVAEAGPDLFYDSVAARLRCCQVRKVEPLHRALTGFDAWMTGLRRDQTASRAFVRKLALDPDHGGIAKLSPLADWSWQQVETYVREHDVPHHALYARGYTSIGCAPCTRPTSIGEDPRAGRWWWESAQHKECGLHLPRLSPSLAVTSSLQE